MLFGCYRFVCQLTKEAILPSYKGSTIRGVFGRALKKVVCVLKRQECKDCFLRERCLYAIAFDTGNIPPPFVLEPPLTNKTSFLKDETVEFSLILFGEINKSLPYIIYALKEAERFPVGKAVDGSKASLRLVEVRKDKQIVYSDEDQIIQSKYLDTELHVPSLKKSNKNNSGRLKIDLVTPLRLKFKNRLKAELPFHVFMRAVLRRIASIFSYYGEGIPDLDYKSLVKMSESVKVIEDNIKWFDWRRYSFRQDQAMFMGGMTGSIVYEGDIEEFVPLIQLCEKLHVGKQTSFGLGKIKLELLE